MPTPDEPLRPLIEAWDDALYGPSGFYRQAVGPAGHFATSAQGLPGVDEVLADVVVEIAHRHGLRQVVEIGCGRGELLTLVAARAPELRLVGADVVARPEGLPERVEWLVSPGADRLPDALGGLSGTLVLAHEWLDVVPCDIAVRTPQGRRLLAVTPDDELVPDGPLSAAQEAWCNRHWPDAEVAEIGLTRDRAYSTLRDRIVDGLLVCVDYAHLAADRPRAGTFVGYRAGTVCAPRFDGSTDLTAHVAMDSLGADRVMTQREVAAAYLPPPASADHATARTDPLGYLAALRARSARTVFTDPTGLGGFLWSFERVTPAGP